jgi:hypothetical protein
MQVRKTSSTLAAIQHMRINHRGPHVLVTQKFLNRADVVARSFFIFHLPFSICHF